MDDLSQKQRRFYGTAYDATIADKTFSRNQRHLAFALGSGLCGYKRCKGLLYERAGGDLFWLTRPVRLRHGILPAGHTWGSKGTIWAQSDLTVWTVDHSTPVSEGGETTLRNGVLACSDCNFEKLHYAWAKPQWIDKRSPFAPSDGLLALIVHDITLAAEDRYFPDRVHKARGRDMAGRLKAAERKYATWIKTVGSAEAGFADMKARGLLELPGRPAVRGVFQSEILFSLLGSGPGPVLVLCDPEDEPYEPSAVEDCFERLCMWMIQDRSL